MINAFVRDLAEKGKRYDMTEEFPQTPWHFVILFQDWALSPRNAQVYALQRASIWSPSSTRLDYPNTSKHIICVTIFHADTSGNERGKTFWTYEGESDKGLFIFRPFFRRSAPQTSSSRFLDDWLLFPQLPLPSLDNHLAVLAEAPGCCWPHPEEHLRPHPSGESTAGNPALILSSFFLL